MSAADINKQTLSFFFRFIFTDSRGFHITALSSKGVQVRKDDTVENYDSNSGYFTNGRDEPRRSEA